MSEQPETYHVEEREDSYAVMRRRPEDGEILEEEVAEVPKAAAKELFFEIGDGEPVGEFSLTIGGVPMAGGGIEMGSQIGTEIEVGGGLSVTFMVDLAGLPSSDDDYG